MTKLATCIGDSITVLSESSIASAVSGLNLGWTVADYATDGYTIAEMAPDVPIALARDPEAIIINLGTDDALQHNQNAVSDLGAIVNQIAAAGTPGVTFVTVSEVAGYPDNSVGIALNAYIAGLPLSYPTWRVINWWRVSSADASKYLSSYDAIHPTSAGQAWLGASYACVLRDLG